MSTEIPDPDRVLLRSYLLGALSRVDQENVENRFASEPAYFALYEALEEELVRTYVNETMTPQDRQHFEGNYLVTTSRIQRVHVLQALVSVRRQRHRRSILNWGRMVPAFIAVALIVVAVSWASYRTFGRRNRESEVVRNTVSGATSVDAPQATAGESSPIAGETRAAEQPRMADRAAANQIKEDDTAVESSTTPQDGPAKRSEGAEGILARETPNSVADPNPPAAEAQIRPESNTIAQKRTLAIGRFQFSAPIDELQSAFGTRENIGTGIKALMTELITQNQKLTVVESDLSPVYQTVPGIAADARQLPTSQPGQPQGVDLVLLGDISTFGHDVRSISIPSALLGNGRLESAKGNKTAVVINYRLVDAKSRQIVLSGQVRGESKREGRDLFGGSAAADPAEGRAPLDMRSTAFAQTILGEATMDSVQKLAAVIADKIPTLSTGFVEVEARVAAVLGSQVTINAGFNDGVRAGDVFQISKILQQIKDPASGQVIDLQLQPVGELVITDVRPKTASGNYSGSPVTPADYARKKRP